MDVDNHPFVADIDPEFINLRSEVRADLRATEASFRASLTELIGKFPPDLATELQAEIAPLAGRFMCAMFPLASALNQVLELMTRLAVEYQEPQGRVS